MPASALARRCLQLAVKGTAEAVDLVRPRRAGVTVLIYHRVGAGSGSDVDLPVAVFDEQMAELAASGRVRTLDAALDHLALGGRPDGGHEGDDDPLVVVTFDDGTADFAEHAAPVLAHHGVPATLYLATRFVDEQLPFPGDAPPLSWAALRDACADGLVTVGSHTHSHALLDRVDEATAADELDRSIDLIEQHLAHTPRHFAYPKAVAGNAAADTAVRHRFASAAVAGTRANLAGGTDPHLLARSPIQASDGMHWFRKKASGGLTLEDDLRRLANRRRYAGATT